MITVTATNFNAVNSSHLRELCTGGIFTVGNRAYRVTCTQNDIRVSRITETQKNYCGAFFNAVANLFGCRSATSSAAAIQERLIEIQCAQNARESKHAQPTVVLINPYEGKLLSGETTRMHPESTAKLKKIVTLLEEDICTLSASSHRPACDPSGWNMPKEYERTMLRIKNKLQTEISQLSADLEYPDKLEQVEYNLKQLHIQWNSIKSVHYKTQEYLAGLARLKSEHAPNLNRAKIFNYRIKAMLNAVYHFSEQPLAPSDIHEQLENLISIANALSDNDDKVLRQCERHLASLSDQERIDFIGLLKNPRTTPAQLFLRINNF